MQEGLAQERKQGRRYSDCKIGKGGVSSPGSGEHGRNIAAVVVINTRFARK